MAKSPSITILERDMSSYTITSSDTILAIVGYATKGPIGEPTLVTSRAEFNSTFGTAVKGTPFSALAAYRAFNQGNKIIFNRVATETGDWDYIAKQSEVVIKNTIPATSGTMGLDLGSSSVTGLTADNEYSVDIKIDALSSFSASISTAVGETELSEADILSAIQSAISSNGDNATASITNHVITITSKTTGLSSKVLISGGSSGDDLIGEGTPAVAVVPAVDGKNEDSSSTDNIGITSIEKGSATNNISVSKTSRVNPITLESVHKIEIFYDGVLAETFDGLSLTVSDENYFLTIINRDKDNGGSELVRFTVEENNNAQETQFSDGLWALGNEPFEGANKKTESDVSISTYDYTVGTDGYDDRQTSESENSQLFVSALSTNGDLGNTELFDYHILITPDIQSAAVQDQAITLAEFRKDFIYIADPIKGLKYDEVTDWHNGTGGLGRDTPLGSSYVATYWSWLKDYNSDTKEYIWCPPSVFIAEKFMEVDRLYGPWYAPAGDTRGKINASDYEASPSFLQREVLYGDFNAVNPIVNFVSKGLEIYGQKTCIRENTALNRINVRRMIIFAKKLIKKSLETILFEPHNPDSWRRATNLITAILEPIRQAKGIDQYSVIIDDSTNTPDVIAQNIMKGKIKIIPTNTIEIIEMTMQIDKAGASLS